MLSSKHSPNEIVHTYDSRPTWKEKRALEYFFCSETKFIPNVKIMLLQSINLDFPLNLKANSFLNF